MNRKSVCDLCFAVAIGAVCTVLLVAGCSEKETGTRKPNLEPDTFISFGPKQHDLTYFKVNAYWYGVDEDGEVDYFEIATVRSADDQDLGDLNDLDWRRTVARESTFVVASDSCCLGPTENPAGEVQMASAPWGILVRAVDNQGSADQTPASVFFTATNVIPTIEIVIPEKSGSGDLPSSPAHPYFEWQGTDPDGDGTRLQYKYIAMPDQLRKEIRFSHLPDISDTAETAGNEAPPIGKWSSWVPADCTFVKDFDFSLYAGRYPTEDWAVMVVVTVKDEGDAWLPRSLYGKIYNNSKNVYKAFITMGDAGVNIIVDGGSLGRRDAYNSVSTGEIVGMFEGTEVSFRFWGLENRGRGRLAEGYRYYYDSPDGAGSAWNYWTSPEPIRERENPIEWFVRYPVDGSRLTPALGQHVLVVEVRDMNKTVTNVEFPLEVLEGPSRLAKKKVLLIDDNRNSLFEGLGIPTATLEAGARAQWDEILEGVTWDIVDTGPNYAGKASVRAAALATTVIWDVDLDGGEGGDQTFTQLLDSYVKVGGNVIIIGRSPVKACGYWSNPDVLAWRQRSNQPRNRSLPWGGLHWDYDFRPLYNPVEDDTLYNFMWDIFGIKRLEELQNNGFFNAVLPCDACGDAWTDTLVTENRGGDWDGVFENAYYIVETRRNDSRFPLDMELMYSAAYYETGTGGEKIWRHTSGNRALAVYVPAHDGWGHAAYIDIPPYWFEHDKTNAMIRTLLKRFGEIPEGS
jgi:hypothetical protein